MTVPLVFFSLVGVGFFYLQTLVFFPHVRLYLLSLLVFWVGMRPSLGLALALGLVLGALQDSYAATPFGLHLGTSLVVVAMARFCRRRLMVQRLSSQVLASLVALALQESCTQIIILMLGLRPVISLEIVRARGLVILATAALAPLMSLLVLGLEKFLRRWGWRPAGESDSFQPLP
jgi:rod shape-determining protein MreD